MAYPLPDGLRARTLPDVNGLDMHVLEAGEAGAPLVLLLHGFPELCWSWRHQMQPLARAGFHVVAPDQRGYGLTTGADPGQPEQFRILNLVRDAMGLVSALRASEVAAVVGHDFGSAVAAWAAVARPDLFRSCVMMSAPFPGTTPWPLKPARGGEDWQAGLAALGRRHYQWHYSTDAAAQEMDSPEQGMTAFLRAYYHVKSGDWAGNRPFPLSGWTAGELAKLPDYYVMPLDKGMAATVAPHDPGGELGWLGEAELDVYAEAFGRTGFGGGLLWYRAVTSGRHRADFELFAGRQMAGPAMFVAGDRDWGIHQTPGALAAMEKRASVDWRGTHLVPDAGHWVQQEQPDQVTGLLLDFLRRL